MNITYSSKYQLQRNFHNDLKTEMGRYIVDYDNKITGIGDLIFRYLDFNSKIAFSQVCVNCNVRSKRKWFRLDSRDIVLNYIQQGTSFLDYLSAGGWKEGILLTATAASTAFTIAASIKSYQHASQIPPDAPKKTRMEIDPETGKEYKVTYIDHPEAEKAAAWKAGAIISCPLTLSLMSIEYEYLNKVDLDIFFSRSQRDIIDPQSNFALRWTFPGYYKWKWDQLKARLTSNPAGWWRKDPGLSHLICPISKNFILFPVKDNCKHAHYFDYRSVRAFQLNPKNVNLNSCPLNRKKPNNGLQSIQFDKGMFDFIQSRLKQGPGQPLNRIQKRYLRVKDSQDSSKEDLASFKTKI